MRSEVEFYLEDLKSKFAKIDPDQYYLSYSGGKDSHLLYWFIKEYLHDTKIEIVAINTYMEHPEIFQRMKKHADRILVPTMKPFEIKAKYGIPCFSKYQDGQIDNYQRGSRSPSLMQRVNNVRNFRQFTINKTARRLLLSGELHRVSPNCCKYLKKEPAKAYEKITGKKPIMGIRSSESAMRKAQYTSCFTKDMKFTPIHDLSDQWFDWIYEDCNIEIPNIYKYINRTGCMGCPYGSYKGETQKELILLPDFKKQFVIDYFRESYEVLGIDTNIQTIITELI